MIPAATITKLATLGLSADQAAAVAEMMAEVEAATEAKASAAIAAEEAARREKAAAKKRRQRAVLSPIVPGTDRDNAGLTGTDGDTPAPLSSFPPNPPNNYPPTPGTHTHTAPGARADAVAGFEPSSADVAALAADGLGPVDIAAELPPFRDHWLASHDPLPADLGAAFRGFCRHGRSRRKPPRTAEQGARASPAAASVFVADTAPEWADWQAVKKTPSRQHPDRPGVKGWWFPSQSPPPPSAAFHPHQRAAE